MRSKSGDRKSLIDDGRWLSLDRKGKTSKTGLVTSSASSAAVSSQATNEKKKNSKGLLKSPSRSPSRGRSQERDASGEKDESGDARAFWISLDSSQSKEQSSSRKTSRKMSRSSTERKTSKAAKEPPVDYNVDKKSSKIKRGSQVTKRKSEVGMESKQQSEERYNMNMNTVNNIDYNRGSTLPKDGNYPIAKIGSTDEFHSNNNTMKRNSMSRRGTIYDENINRDGFGRDINNALVKRNRSNSNADESKHFLSLQLFNKVHHFSTLMFPYQCNV